MRDASSHGGHDSDSGSDSDADAAEGEALLRAHGAAAARAKHVMALQEASHTLLCDADEPDAAVDGVLTEGVPASVTP